MDLRQIKDLMQAMSRTGMHRLEIKKDDFELTLEHGANAAVTERVVEVPVYNPMRAEVQQHLSAASVVGQSTPLEKASGVEPLSDSPPAEEGGEFITSPMVGTFYTSPSPEDLDFVKVGDTVDEDAVVCIIEAMKVMNEVKAGISGVVTEVLVDNAHPVEFGSKLFRIKPTS